jgi:Lar family restriction alleviation protein
MSNQELKRCPFCGAESPLELGNPYEERFKFQCVGCKAVGPAYRTRPEAISGWNTRPAQDSTGKVLLDAETVEKVVGALKSAQAKYRTWYAGTVNELKNMETPCDEALSLLAAHSPKEKGE